MIRAFLAVLQREVLSLLRTRELYFYGLVPAVCGLPLVFLFSTIAMSFDSGLKLPTADPGFAVEAPRGTLQRDSTSPDDWAVVSWELRDDVLHATAQVESTDQLEVTSDLLREVLVSRQDSQYEKAGGDPLWDRVPLLWSPKKDLLGAAILFLIAVLAAQISMYLIPGRTAEERAGGLFEALAVTATPLAWHLTARAVAGTVLIGTLFTIPVVTIVLLIPADSRPPIPLPFVFEAWGLVLWITSCHVAIGCVVKNSTNALNFSSMMIFVVLGGWMAGLLGGSGLPIVGMGQDAEPMVLGARIVGTWLIAFGVLGGAGWWVRGERALPTGHGDA